MPGTVVRYEIPEAPTNGIPKIVALNVLVFLAWQGAWLGMGHLDVLMPAHFTVSPYHLSRGAVWTLLTSGVSHLHPVHAAFNIMALLLFGRDMERVVGTRGVVHLYVAGAIAASLGHVGYGLAIGHSTPALGASGAVMALAAASAVLFPRRELYVLGVVPVSQRTLIGVFVLIDLVGLAPSRSSPVAHAAHLGGALYGWLYARRHAMSYLRERIRTEGVDAVFQRSVGTPRDGA
jgi:membrane associated rhomboid family serine protease